MKFGFQSMVNGLLNVLINIVFKKMIETTYLSFLHNNLIQNMDRLVKIGYIFVGYVSKERLGLK